MRIWFNTSDLTQWSGLVTRIAFDLGWVHQKYPCTVRSIIGLQQAMEHALGAFKLLEHLRNLFAKHPNLCEVGSW
jgi:hypothetical protein